MGQAAVTGFSTFLKTFCCRFTRNDFEVSFMPVYSWILSRMSLGGFLVVYLQTQPSTLWGRILCQVGAWDHMYMAQTSGLSPSLRLLNMMPHVSAMAKWLRVVFSTSISLIRRRRVALLQIGSNPVNLRFGQMIAPKRISLHEHFCIMIPRCCYLRTG